MRYKLLGESGLRVSEVCLGTMTFGKDWGWGASKEESRQIFDEFVNAGGNFIDTACNYTNGTSEEFVGEFTATERDYFVIATKYTLRRPGSKKTDLNAGGNHRKNMIRSVEASLKRLKTDCIDLLYLHIWDFTTPIEEILRGMEDLVSAGKILYPGISDTPAWIVSQGQTLARLRGWPGFVAYQGEYNLLERGIEQDVIPMTRALGMSLLTFGLLGGGALTGKFNQPGKPAQATRIKETSELEKVAASIVMQIASETGHTPSQISINWVRQQAENIIPILGARRLSQIVDNLGAIEFTLDGEHIQRLSDIHPQHPIYPHTFWNDFVRRDLIFGDHLDSLD